LQHKITPVLWPAFLISLIAITGGIWIAGRMASGKPTSPGEMLWLAVGAAQLVYVVAFVNCYRY